MLYNWVNNRLVISLMRPLRVKNSYDGFEQNITFGILSEACDLDLRTHISLLHDLLWLTSVQLSNSYFRLDEYTCILSNYHLYYIWRSWCKPLHIHIYTWTQTIARGRIIFLVALHSQAIKKTQGRWGVSGRYSA